MTRPLLVRERVQSSARREAQAVEEAEDMSNAKRHAVTVAEKRVVANLKGSQDTRAALMESREQLHEVLRNSVVLEERMRSNDKVVEEAHAMAALVRSERDAALATIEAMQADAKKGRKREQVLDMRVSEAVEDRDKALHEALEAKAAATRHEAKVTELIASLNTGTTSTATEKRTIWELEQQVTLLQTSAQATSAKVRARVCTW